MFKYLILHVLLSLLWVGNVFAQTTKKPRIKVWVSNSSTDSYITIQYVNLADSVVHDKNPVLLMVIDNKKHELTKKAGEQLLLNKRQDSTQVTFFKPQNSNFELDRFGKFIVKVHGHEFVLEYKGIPLSILYFKGIFKGMHTKLEWKTAAELETAYFIVEKSNGTTFKEVGRVKAAGNSSSPLNYILHDYVNDKRKVDYYRLKTLESSGRYYYSNVISVNKDANDRNFIGFRIKLDETPLYLLLYNPSGRLIKQINLLEYWQTQIPALPIDGVIKVLITDKARHSLKIMGPVDFK